MLNKNSIKIRSNELEIPFSKLLSLAVCQEVISELAQSEFGDTLYLCNGQDYAFNKINEDTQRNIFYVCCSADSEKEDPDFLKRLDTKLKEIAGNKGQMLETDKRNWGLKLSYNIDGMYVPVQLYISWSKEEEPVFEEESLNLIMSNNQVVSYKAYPKETLVSKHVYEIVSKLELINNMSHYYEAYKLLCNNSISGRKAKESLIFVCKRHNMKMSTSVIDNLKRYRNYSYMEKKWKAYKRQENLSEVEWKDVIDCLISYIEPIWKAIIKDEIFIDDWMPQLKRYLD